MIEPNDEITAYMNDINAMQNECLNLFFGYVMSHGADLDRAMNDPEYEPSKRFNDLKAARDRIWHIAFYECETDEEMDAQVKAAGEDYMVKRQEFIEFVSRS